LHRLRNYPTSFSGEHMAPNLLYLTRAWWHGLSKFESEILAAVDVGETRMHSSMFLSHLTPSARKHQATELIKDALRESSIPFRPIPSGGTAYLWLPRTALVRVKAMNGEDRPVNFQTPTHLRYLNGDLLPDLPDLPRVDVSYRLDPVTSSITWVGLREWEGRTLVAEYTMPWRAVGAAILETIELPLPERVSTVRPRAGAKTKGQRGRKAADGSA